MATSEHRITPRFKLHPSLSFHRIEPLSDAEHQSNAINISTTGVYFATKIVLRVGEVVEVLLRMPKRVSGVKTEIRRFKGRVTHIESENMPPGVSGIGVQFLYFEIRLVAISPPSPARG
ncbi:MAG: PilZ domain-containing protein [Candidatus Acidiferrales bacterium]